MSSNKLSPFLMLATFPSEQHLEQFEKDGGDIKLLIERACTSETNSEKTKESLIKCINNALTSTQLKEGKKRSLPKELSFRQLFLKQNKISFLKNKASDQSNIEEINNLCSEYGFPKINSLSISRLKDTTKIHTKSQRNTIRALAFYFNFSSSLDYKITYDTLLELIESKVEKTDEGCLVVIGFPKSNDKQSPLGWLEAQNGIIFFAKDFLIDRLSENLLSLKFPLGRVDNEETTPKTHKECVSQGLAIVHQLMIAWDLSKNSTIHEDIIFAMGVGKLSSYELQSSLVSIASDPVPNNPRLRITEQTRTAILVNDLRVTLSSTPYESLINNQKMQFYWVEDWWSHIYYKLPAKENLPKDNSLQNFTRLIDRKPNSYALGLELSKILFNEARFWEAYEIIQRTLNYSPNKTVARALKMAILYALAQKEKNYSIAKLLFDRGDQEAKYIECYCRKDEDSKCETALGALSHALFLLRALRSSGQAESKDKFHEYSYSIKDVFSKLNQAESILEEGMAIANAIGRSFYLLMTIKSFKYLLLQDKWIAQQAKIDCAKTNKEPANQLIQKSYINLAEPDISDEASICKTISANMFRSVGWIRQGKWDEFDHEHTKILIYNLEQAISLYNNVVKFQPYRPTALYAFAVIAYDFWPGTLRMWNIEKAISYLLSAKNATEYLKKRGGESLTSYAFTISRLNIELLKLETVEGHIETAIKELSRIKKKAEELAGGPIDANHPLPNAKEASRLKLFTLNVFS